MAVQTQKEEVQEELQRRTRQFLVHSFLYYTLDESIIHDTQYDAICERLSYLIHTYPHVEVPYIDITRQVETSGSGFYIQEYPPAIISTAFRMLWLHKKRNTPGFTEGYPQFISRWGRHIEKE